jgi:transcriptional regulator with XRE-family HTH domain
MEDEPDVPLSFGAELRRRRLAAGWSLAKLAHAVHYSTGQLSKLENGHKFANQQFARVCDGCLDAGGALVAAWDRDERRLTQRMPPDPTDSDRGSTTPPWLPDLWVVPMNNEPSRGLDRRRVLAGLGASAIMAIGPAPVARWVDPQTVTAYRATFDQLRARGQFQRPDDLLPTLLSEMQAITRLALGAEPSLRSELLRLASHFAENAGWMAQESGRDEWARRLTGHAVLLADRGGVDMSAYRQVRLADMALYEGNARATVGLAGRAVRAGRDPRITGLAAQRLAQGYALANDRAACFEALRLAERMLDRADRERAGSDPVVGSTTVVDHVAMATGWCLYDLGEPGPAATALSQEVRRLPAEAHRARARYGTRLARCYADLGEIDLACETAGPLLRRLSTLDSATVAVDVAGLAESLRRHRSYPVVRSLYPYLIESSRRASTMGAIS